VKAIILGHTALDAHYVALVHVNGWGRAVIDKHALRGQRVAVGVGVLFLKEETTQVRTGLKVAHDHAFDDHARRAVEGAAGSAALQLVDEGGRFTALAEFNDCAASVFCARCRCKLGVGIGIARTAGAVGTTLVRVTRLITTATFVDLGLSRVQQDKDTCII